MEINCVLNSSALVAIQHKQGLIVN